MGNRIFGGARPVKIRLDDVVISGTAYHPATLGIQKNENVSRRLSHYFKCLQVASK